MRVTENLPTAEPKAGSRRTGPGRSTRAWPPVKLKTPSPPQGTPARPSTHLGASRAKGPLVHAAGLILLPPSGQPPTCERLYPSLLFVWSESKG